MSLRLSALAESLRGSLFFVPMLFVLGGIAAGIGAIELDELVDANAAALPLVLTSTVDSARVVLSVVASATITVAGIAFSVALLVIQQASSQYSPRLVHSLFRDPFNRRVMGLSVGTFTYCLMVLRTVRDALDDGGEAIIPNLSVAFAVLLGVTSILGIVAFIDHNAHSMEVSAILSRVTDQTVDQIERTWALRIDEDEGGGAGSGQPVDEGAPDGRGCPVAFHESGWLQQVDADALLDLVAEGGTVRLETRPGRFAVAGTPLCTVWPAPADGGDELADRARSAVQIGSGRTMQQDPSYGIRQLVDVALKALSPGVNDPTTAQDAIFHLTAVLREALVRDLPPRVVQRDGRRLLRVEDHTHHSLVGLAFDETRRVAAGSPAVCAYLLESLHLLHRSVLEAGHPERAADLHEQAELVLAGAEAADLLPGDLAALRGDFVERFGAPIAAP